MDTHQQTGFTRSEARFEAATLADGRLAHLLAVRTAGHAAVMAVVRLPSDGTLLVASGAFAEEAIHRGLGPLVDAMPSRPIHYDDLRDLGVFVRGKERPYGLVDALHVATSALEGNIGSVSAFVNYRGRTSVHAVLGHNDWSGGATRYPCLPIVRPRDRTRLPLPETEAEAAPGSVMPLAPETDDRTREAAEAWLRSLELAVRPAGMRLLGEATWTAEAYAWLSAPGRVGEWRRQAASLHPAFACTFAHDAELGRLVDEGRPFEGRLADLATLSARRLPNGASFRQDVPAVTLPKVRRMRGLDLPMWRSGPRHAGFVLSGIAEFPTGDLPHGRDGWRRFLDDALPFLMVLDAYDLVPARAMRGLGPEWKMPLDPRSASHLQCEMQDMAEYLANTLVGPACGDSLAGLPVSVERLCGHLLFSADTLMGIARRVRDWHAGLHRLQASIATAGEDGSADWPALFEPWERDGLRIACLTSQADLSAEGSLRKDRDGMAGLAHCVGGYAPRCREGISHVASIRLVAAGRPVARLATAEIGVENGRPVLLQLRSNGNEEPPMKVSVFAAWFMDTLAKGYHPMNRAAAVRRMPQGWRRYGPEEAEAALAAWRPFLPRRMRARDVAGLREQVRSGIAASYPPTPTTPGTETSRP